MTWYLSTIFLALHFPKITLAKDSNRSPKEMHTAIMVGRTTTAAHIQWLVSYASKFDIVAVEVQFCHTSFPCINIFGHTIERSGSHAIVPLFCLGGKNRGGEAWSDGTKGMFDAKLCCVDLRFQSLLW